MNTLQKLRARKQEIDAMPAQKVVNRIGSTGKKGSKPVLCLSHNRRFESLIEAAKWMTQETQKRCQPACIGQAIRRNGGRYKGFQFKYEDSQ